MEIYAYIYASPSPGEAYRDRRLTTNFELKFFVCRHVSMWGFQNRVCLSVRTPRKENHHSFVNICPTLVIDTSMERSSRVLQHGNPNFDYFFKKFEIEFWLVLKSWNHYSSRSQHDIDDDIGDASSYFRESISSFNDFFQLWMSRSMNLQTKTLKIIKNFLCEIQKCAKPVWLLTIKKKKKSTATLFKKNGTK